MLLLVFTTCMWEWVLFFMHILFMASCTFNAVVTERLQQHPLFFTTNCTNRTPFLWRLHAAWLSHPGQHSILLWLKSLSSKCTKLGTVTTSNNNNHTPQSLYYCLFIQLLVLPTAWKIPRRFSPSTSNRVKYLIIFCPYLANL